MEKLLFKSELKLDSKFLAKALIRLVKQDIFKRFIETGTLSEEDQEFCDKIFWYPIDEFEVKEGYVEKLKKIENGPHSSMTLEKLDKLTGVK